MEERTGVLTVEEWDGVEASGRPAWGALAFALSQDPAVPDNNLPPGGARLRVTLGKVTRAYAWAALERLEAQAAAWRGRAAT